MTDLDQELTRFVSRIRDLADSRWQQARHMPVWGADLDQLHQTVAAARELDRTVTETEFRLFANASQYDRLLALQDVLGVLMRHELETVQAAATEAVPEDEIAAAWQNFTGYRRRRDRARVELAEAQPLPF